jgi:hypothetical protein
VSYEKPAPFVEKIGCDFGFYLRTYSNDTELIDGLSEDNHDLYNLIIEDDYDMDEGQPELIYDLIAANRSMCNYVYKSGIRTFDRAFTSFQAVSRGAMTRNRVLPAMLSPDPTYLRQAVLFCVNGFK